ncbi:MAG: hypothetical protein PGN07_09640 [Aeromicrobium erythreum]
MSTEQSTRPDAAAPTTRSDVPVRVVLGPLTRLGRELVRSTDDAQLRLVSRGPRDTDRLDVEHVVDVDERDARALVGAGTGPVEVVVCALGPVHPEPETDVTDAVERELGLVGAVLDAAGERPVRVVLVSSVVALAPGADRRYYAGWKNLVEARVRALAAGRASVAVLYPGRLLDAVDRTRPWHRLHATYARVCRGIEQALAGRSTSAVVGLDARLWLLTRALRLVRGGLLPASAALPTPLTDRQVSS